MNGKKHRKWHAAQTKKQIEEIKRDYPPDKVRELLNAGMTEEQTAARLGLGLTDYNVLLVLYRCTGDLQA